MVFISMVREAGLWPEPERQVSPISRWVLARRNANLSLETENNHRRENAREKGRQSGVALWKRNKEREVSAVLSERERSQRPLYKPGNTLGSTSCIHTKDENEGRRQVLDYCIN